MIGIQADLGGQIEGHRKPGGAVGQQIVVALVGLFGVAHAGVLAHGPQPSAIHGGLNAAGVGKFAGKADLLLATLALFSRRVQRLNFDAGAGMGILAGGHVRLLWPGHQDFLTARRARQNALAENQAKSRLKPRASRKRPGAMWPRLA